MQIQVNYCGQNPAWTLVEVLNFTNTLGLRIRAYLIARLIFCVAISILLGFSNPLATQLRNYQLMDNNFSNSESQISSIFIELYVCNIPYNIELFSKILGFKVIRNEGDFAELRLRNSMLLLNDGSDLEYTHPFKSRLDPANNGIGTEIGFDVSNLSKVYEQASGFSGIKVSEIKMQSWGLKDFRIITPDNYYLRVTELLH